MGLLEEHVHPGGTGRVGGLEKQRELDQRKDGTNKGHQPACDVRMTDLMPPHHREGFQ